MQDVASLLGRIDIYLLDQILRGRITSDMSVLDAGSGAGRNLEYFLRAGHEVFAVDQNPEAVASVRSLAARLGPRLPAENFRLEDIESMSFAETSVDVLVSSAVLHFARNDEQFWAMLRGAWRVLRPRGLSFCRLASTIGMEDRMQRLEGRRFRLPDGSERYLVDEPMLMEATASLGADLLDPLKTTVVQDQRCMTTWVLRKRS